MRIPLLARNVGEPDERHLSQCRFSPKVVAGKTRCFLVSEDNIGIEVRCA